MKVKVIVFDRRSVAHASSEFEFTDFKNLKKEVDDFIEILPFSKVFVEMLPVDFEPMPDQERLLTAIKNGDKSAFATQ
jgi:hypothetical protein